MTPGDLQKSIEEDGNFKDFEMFHLKSDEGTYFEDGLKISKKTGVNFDFRGRVARPLDFDRIVSHLKTEEDIMIIGPIYELELINHRDVVPDGVVMAPVHFLTVPLEQYRDALDNDGDVHYVLKITKEGEKFSVKKYPSTARFDSKFCVETGELAGEKLCYITTGIFGFGRRAVCNHSAIKTFHTLHDARLCPQTNNDASLAG